MLVPAVLLAPVLLIASAGLWLLGRRPPDERARRRLHGAAALALGLAAVAVVVAPFYRTVGAAFEFVFRDPSGVNRELTSEISELW